MLVTLACAGRQPPVAAPARTCVDQETPRWPILTPGIRSLLVWLDVAAQELDGWRSYGMRRLRFALDEWNSIRLPVRFAAAQSAREADIVVDIIEFIPAPDDSTGRDQAGLTNLTYLPTGEILKARVLIATRPPQGRGRYSVLDQQANLLHELGHAIGLPHITVTSAVMAIRRTSYSLTGADIILARAYYPDCFQRPP
jgi:matrixin